MSSFFSTPLIFDTKYGFVPNYKLILDLKQKTKQSNLTKNEIFCEQELLTEEINYNTEFEQ